MVIDAVVAHLSGGVRTFDDGGRLAARGKVCERLLAKMMSHRYLAKRPPKTTGREEFGEVFVRQVLGWAGWEVVTGSRARHSVRAIVGFGGDGHGPARDRPLRPAGRSARPTDRRLNPEDTVATATAFTAASIANAYERFVFPRLDAAQRPKMQVILGGGGAKNPTLRRMLAERLGSADLLTHEDFGLANAAKEALAFAILAHETLLGHPANVPAATGARRPVVLGKIVPGRL
jgi:anhydro-N-acetylmuramic acid kinase